MRSSGWRKRFAGATFKDQTVQLQLRRLSFRSFCSRPCSGSQRCCCMRGQRSHGLWGRCNISCSLSGRQCLRGPWRCQWRCQRPSWRPWSSPWRSHRNGSMRPRSKAPQDTKSRTRASQNWSPWRLQPRSGRSCLKSMARFQEMQVWRACTRWILRHFGSRASSRSSGFCQLV